MKNAILDDWQETYARHGGVEAPVVGAVLARKAASVLCALCARDGAVQKGLMPVLQKAMLQDHLDLMGVLAGTLRLFLDQDTTEMCQIGFAQASFCGAGVAGRAFLSTYQTRPVRAVLTDYIDMAQTAQQVQAWIGPDGTPQTDYMAGLGADGYRTMMESWGQTPTVVQALNQIQKASDVMDEIQKTIKEAAAQNQQKLDDGRAALIPVLEAGLQRAVGRDARAASVLDVARRAQAKQLFGENARDWWVDAFSCPGFLGAPHKKGAASPVPSAPRP